MSQGYKIQLGGEAVIVAAREHVLAYGKANGFRCPAGRAVGRGGVLLLRKSLDKLGIGGGPYPLQFETVGDEATTVKLAKVYIHSAVRTNGGGRPDDPNAVYFVRLVDSRFFLDQWTDTTNHSFNVRSYAGGDPYKDYLPDTVKENQKPYSWDEIAAILWGECKIIGSYPGLPDMPKTTGPENVRLIGSAWHALNDLVEKLGFYIVYDPRSDFYRIAKAKTLGSNPSRSSLYDSVAFSPQACLLPEKIRVYFSKQFQDYGTERDTESDSNWSTTEAIYFVDVPTNAEGAIGGTTKSIWVETPAIREAGTERLLNEANLKTLAAERAQGWININQADKLSRLDFIDQGLLDVVPNEELKVVWWRAFYNEGLVTEVITHPGMPTDGEGLGFSMPSVSGTGGSLVGGSIDVLKESNSAPDLARATYPNYPRLPNQVKLTLGTAAAGAGGFVKAYERNFIFGGNVIRYSPAKGDLEDLENCWIYLTGQSKNTPNQNPKLPGPLSELGQIYTARLSGTYTATTGQYKGRRLPLYVCTADDVLSVSQACACGNVNTTQEVQNLERVTRLTFDKGVGFKLFQNYSDLGQACVGLYGCLPNSILNQQQAYPNRPVWTQSPRLGGNLTIGGALKFGDQSGSVMGNGADIRLPGVAGTCGLPVETVGTNGACVQLGYGMKGYSGLFQTYDCYGVTCSTFLVHNGRIVYSNAPYMAPYTCQGSSPCPPADTQPCNPCSQSQSGSPGAPGEVVEPPFRTIQDGFTAIGFSGIPETWQSGQPAISGFGIGSSGTGAVLSGTTGSAAAGSNSNTNTGATATGASNTIGQVVTGGTSSSLVDGKYPICSSWESKTGGAALFRDSSPYEGWKKAETLILNDFRGYRPLTADKAAELLRLFSDPLTPNMKLSTTTFESFKRYVFRCNAVDLGQTASTTTSATRPPYSVECKCSGFLFYPTGGTPTPNFTYAAGIVKNLFKQWRPLDSWDGVNQRLLAFDPSNTNNESFPNTYALTEDEFAIFRLELYCIAKAQFDSEGSKIWWD